MEVARSVAAPATVAAATAAAQGDMASGRPTIALEEIRVVASMEAKMEASTGVTMEVATEDTVTRETASMAGTSLATWLKMDTEAILILETLAMGPTRVAVLATVATRVATTVLEEMAEPVTLATEVATTVETLVLMEDTINARPATGETKVESPKFKLAGPQQAGRSSAMHARLQPTKLP